MQVIIRGNQILAAGCLQLLQNLINAEAGRLLARREFLEAL